jgi:hypothetical protein
MYTSRAILAVSVFFVVGEAFRKKSSKTDAELEGGSFVEAEANTKAGERAQTLKDMKALAHKVVAGEEKIYPETLKALEKVEWVIHVAENEVKPQWTEHQNELDDAKQMFDDCKAEYIRKTLEINETEGKRTGEFTNIHDKSRISEQQALDNKGSTCKTFEDYNDNASLSLPKCASNFPHECKFDDRSLCIDELAAWSNYHIPTYNEKKIACEDAVEKHKNASETAKINQDNLELELCRWGLKLNDVCENYLEGCWEKAMRNREKVHPRIVISEKALKAEYFAIQKIKCYINVLKVSEEVRVAELKKCEDLEYNDLLTKTAEDTLSNTYHPIPEKPVCLKVPEPCDAEWRKATYVDQSWFEFKAGPVEPFCDAFPRGPEIVNPSDCLKECPLPPVVGKCTASVYQHANFRGNVATFAVGEYKHDEFVNRGPLRNDKASSIKVQGPPGCKATVYGKDNFDGWQAEFRVGKYDIDEFKKHGAINDEASSIKVTLG